MKDTVLELVEPLCEARRKAAVSAALCAAAYNAEDEGSKDALLFEAVFACRTALEIITSCEADALKQCATCEDGDQQ